MNGYEVVLLDLDGTLTDPKEGITRSIQYALAKLGILTDDLDQFEPFIGPPLLESFGEYLGGDSGRAELAVLHYRERFSRVGLYENKVYPGIEDLLSGLRSAGKTLILATAKPTVYAEEILRHFGLKDFFDEIVGANLDGTRVNKTEVIEHIMASCPQVRGRRVVMVGDRLHDMIGACHCGLAAIGVCWGYGSRAELLQAGATHLVDEVAELSALLLGTVRA